MADKLNNDDLFIVGNQTEKRTYKTTYDTVQRKIQQDTNAVTISSTDRPDNLDNGDPLLNGTLWFRPARGADTLFIYNNGNFIPVSGSGGGISGVDRIIAGDNIHIDPLLGVGTVTIHSVIKYPDSIGPGTGDNPSDPQRPPEDGDLWIDMSQCPPKLMIYTECGEDGPEHLPIGPDEIQYVMEDNDGNVFVRGNVYVKGSVDGDFNKPNFIPEKNVRIDQYGDLYIEGSLFCKENAETAVFVPVIPENPVPYDADGDVNIRGNLYVLGDIIAMSGG